MDAPPVAETAIDVTKPLNELRQYLAHAAAKTADNPQKAAAFALGAVANFLGQLNFPADQRAIFDSLFNAMRDLQDRTTASILKAPLIGIGGRYEPSEVWLTKTFLAGALEAEIALGGTLTNSSQKIIRLAGEASKVFDVDGGEPTVAASAKRLLALRKELRRSKSAGPANGIHRTAWKEMSELIASAKVLPDASMKLKKLSAEGLRQARKYAPPAQ